MKKLLFTPILLFLLISHAFAEEENELTATSRISPRTLTVGEQFTLTITLNYPSAEYVNVLTPPFPPSLNADRFVIFPRIIDSEPHTIIEFRFTANAPGRISLDSFTILTPAGIVDTSPFVFNIYSADSVNFTPRIFWEGAPRTITAGERVTLTLRANGWNAQQPPPSFFMPVVPRGVILSLSSVSPEERESGIAAKFTLIPLTSGDFRLPARSLQHGNTRFEIPSLFIRIN